MKKILPTCLTLLLSYSIKTHCQELISAELLESYSLTALQLGFGDLVENGVSLYKIRYNTTGIDGSLDTASGLFIVPDTDGDSIPLLSYQHGIVTSRNDVPSNLKGGYEIAVIWGGLGYAVAAADYLGLGESRGFHPFFHAATESSAAIDLLFAAEEFSRQNSIPLDNRLYLSGYAQGAHSTMAIHKSLEEDHVSNFNLIAAAPMSGLYSMSGEMRDIILTDQTYLFPNYVGWTLLSYNLAHDLGYTLEELFKPPYVEPIRQFNAEEIDLFQLNGMLIQALVLNHGNIQPKGMFQDSIIDQLRLELNPPINLALKENDTFDWAPKAPIRMLYCQSDEQFSYKNSVVADSVMNLRGALNVEALDVNSNAGHLACLEPALINASRFFDFVEVITPVVNEDTGPASPQVYPNPVKTILHLQDLGEIKRIEVLDSEGRIRFILRQNDLVDQTEINMEGLPPGMYLLKMIGEQSVFLEKVIKE